MPRTGRSPDDQQLQVRREIGDRIRRYRIAQGMSQERLAEAAGLDRQTVGNYELARTPASIDHLVAIARALNVPLVNLFWH
jgi:transcriptional regulator with XRE-family HTH domain